MISEKQREEIIASRWGMEGITVYISHFSRGNDRPGWAYHTGHTADEENRVKFDAVRGHGVNRITLKQ